MRLESARTVAEAKIALRELQKNRRDHSLPVLRRSPRLVDYWAEYFRFYAEVKDAKRLSTLHREKSARNNWLIQLGDLRLNEITRKHLNGYITKRQASGTAPRTVNLDLIALRNVLKRALDDGLLKTLPMENLRPLKVDQQKRKLITQEEMEKIFAAAATLPISEAQLADVLKLMAACGARIAESLRLRWTDVDFSQLKITIGSDGLEKNRRHRVVDFNRELETQLAAMFARRPPDSAWIFPSPRRGELDVLIVNFNKALRSACEIAGLPDFGFHDCRHLGWSIRQN